MKLIIATCQFPISSSISHNAEYIIKQMKSAKIQGADIAHFPEACFSGYAGADFSSYLGFDWMQLKQSTLDILAEASKLRLCVILGSTHRLSGNHKPHNSLYIIDNHGRIIGRYDKMFCAGNKKGDTNDLAHYNPGNHFFFFTLNSIRCGTLICHDYRYPELYRQYKLHGAQVIFHSFHAGHMSLKQFDKLKTDVGIENHKHNPGSTLPGITMPAAMITSAADNYVWISCSNTSARQNCWPSFFVRPDGVVIGRLRLNKAGILISRIDTKKKFYDSSVTWRNRAIKGIYHSGNRVNDIRSRNLTSL
jgi:predicted amidohydrolase